MCGAGVLAGVEWQDRAIRLYHTILPPLPFSKREPLVDMLDIVTRMRNSVLVIAVAEEISATPSTLRVNEIPGCCNGVPEAAEILR
jgi:hypothetical protein